MGESTLENLLIRRAVSGLVAILVALGGGFYTWQANRAVAETYGLDANQSKVMALCVKDVKMTNTTYAANVSDREICACIAGDMRVSDEVALIADFVDRRYEGLEKRPEKTMGELITLLGGDPANDRDLKTIERKFRHFNDDYAKSEDRCWNQHI